MPEAPIPKRPREFSAIRLIPALVAGVPSDRAFSLSLLPSARARAGDKISNEIVDASRNRIALDSRSLQRDFTLGGNARGKMPAFVSRA